MPSGKCAARKVPSGKVPVTPRKQLPSQRTPEEQAARKRARAAAPSGLKSEPTRDHPQLWSDGDGVHIEQQAVRVGDSYQAQLPPLLVDSVEPPPAAPPRCWCAKPAVWERRRWWCAEGTCEFEAEPPPRAAPRGTPSYTPLCHCGAPAVWLRGRWWCGLGGGEQDGGGSSAAGSSAAGSSAAGSSAGGGEGGEAETERGGPVHSLPHGAPSGVPKCEPNGVTNGAPNGLPSAVPRGCGFELLPASLAEPPEPTRVCPREIAVACARGTAALLTAAAYGPG